MKNFHRTYARQTHLKGKHTENHLSQRLRVKLPPHLKGFCAKLDSGEALQSPTSPASSCYLGSIEV